MSTAPSTRSRGAFSNGMWGAVQQTLAVASSSAFSLLLILFVPVREYGVYSYGISLASIGIAVMSAGLSGLAVKALVVDRARNAGIVTSLLLIREGFALGAYVLLVSASLTSGDSLTIAVTCVSCLALFGRAFDAPELWFVSQMRSRRVATARIGVTVALFAFRMVALFLWPHVELFVALYVLEALLAAALIVIKYLRERDSPGLGKPDRRIAKELMGSSWPLMLSSVANQLNLRGDVLLIQAFLGAASVGIYSAAARLSEVANFLPVVFMNATFPVLLDLRKSVGGDHPDYHRALQKSYDRAFWAGVVVAVGVASVGSALITLVFSDTYAPAVPVLCISLVACPFVFMAAVYSKWIIAENILWSSLTRHAFGAVLNLTLNVVLLPTYGIIGSAWATLISYVASSYLACFLGKKSRFAARQMTLAIIAPLRLLLRAVRGSRARGTTPRKDPS